jgi:hypothetical protein
LTIELDDASNSVAVNQWVSRLSLIKIVGIDNEWRYVDICLRFYVGEGIYGYFPFNYEVHSLGASGEIVEVSEPCQCTEARVIGIEVQNGTVLLQLTSECGGIPFQIGVGDDQRELSLLLVEIDVIHTKRLNKSSLKVESLQTPWRTYIGNSPKPPIFIIGPYRSGTSITTWAVGQHPNIAPMEETGWVHSSLIALKAAYRLANNRPKSAAHEYDFPESEYVHVMAEQLNDLHLKLARRRSKRIMFKRLANMAPHFTPELQLERSAWTPKNRWVDGTPEHTLSARLLAKSFEDCQFLFLVREPRQVIRSLVHFDRAGGQPMSVSDAVTHWIKFTAACCDLYHVIGPQRCKLVIFENLLQSPEVMLRDVYAFLGENYFAPAAKALSRRINSSDVDHLDINIEPRVINMLADLYDELMRGEIPDLSQFGFSETLFEEMSEWAIEAVCSAIS